MWWNGELEECRRQVERAKRRIDPADSAGPPGLSGSRGGTPMIGGFSVGNLAALAFAIASIVGPLRVLRVAIAAASAYRAVRALEAPNGRR